jgi:disulfide bond formation protein DsbB
MLTLKYINATCIIILCSVLIGALYFQFVLGEDPCPLCLLQRMGMMGVIFALSLNIFFGFNPSHFAVVIIAAIIGGIFSIRQVLLHIAPVNGDTGYGTPVLGMHLYTWGAIIFLACILGSAVFLFFNNKYTSRGGIYILKFEKYTFYLATLIILVNVVATIFECQLGPCCDYGPCK